MLTYRRTSIMESTAQTLVNTVNCVGVMGKGLAKAFKEREPDMFRAYKKICDGHLLEPGKLWLWRGVNSWVLNFPTKNHWRQPAKLEWIELGLQKFVAEYTMRGIREISFPRLGCGNGGLHWDEVRPVMEHYLKDVSIPVYIHDHTRDIGLPEHLEFIAQQLKQEHVQAVTFEGFLSAIKRMTEIGGNNLVELGSERPFQAHVDGEGNLSIEIDQSDMRLDPEDLRGIWMSFLGGVVTHEKAGWSRHESGGPILSMLSVLPMARPIEIERLNRKPETAVEFRPTSSVTPLIEHSQLSWV